jgi:hypothetical protein
MARKVWVLDTETKGTGAEMVPLERLQNRRRSAQDGARAAERRRFREALRRRQPEAEEEPEPRHPRHFKVVDVLTRETLAEDVGVRQALEVLAGTRSVVDVIVYVWDRQAQEWRPLTMREQKVLWDERQAAARSESGSDSPVS